MRDLSGGSGSTWDAGMIGNLLRRSMPTGAGTPNLRQPNALPAPNSPPAGVAAPRQISPTARPMVPMRPMR